MLITYQQLIIIQLLHILHLKFPTLPFSWLYLKPRTLYSSPLLTLSLSLCLYGNSFNIWLVFLNIFYFKHFHIHEDFVFISYFSVSFFSHFFFFLGSLIGQHCTTLHLKTSLTVSEYAGIVTAIATVWIAALIHHCCYYCLLYCSWLELFAFFFFLVCFPCFFLA